jgi:membrane protein DedA with SNARE-associated domain
MAFPPVAGAVQLRVSWFTPAVAVGAVIVAGTVVAVTVVVDEAAEVPAVFVAVTLTVYVTAEARLSTTIGDEAPVAVLVV